ncbi:MAG: GNAT family N-acetyltransferase [Rhodoblastus sp.]|nr:MAG: GNAT family N-acetyltransferase [Rhodoblastus sp.]
MSREAFSISVESPDASGVAALLDAGAAAMAALYPAESDHTPPPDALRGEGATLLVARDGDGRAVATGALWRQGGEAEIKRMWVDPARRGRGVARALLRRLEEEAQGRGATTLRLETGVASLAALRLYAAAGYRRRGPFGGYRDDPLSIFMEKPLPESGGAAIATP